MFDDSLPRLQVQARLQGWKILAVPKFVRLLALLALVWCVPAIVAHAAEPVFLGPQADHLLDVEGSLRIDELAGPNGAALFTLAGGKAANYGPRPTPHAVLWLRFRLPESSPGHAGHSTLTFEELRIRRATLYQQVGQTWLARVWNAEKSAESPQGAAFRYPAFLVDLKRDGGTTAYLKIETASSMRAMLYIQSASQFLYKYSNESLNYGIAIGLLGTLELYLFAAGLAARDTNALLLSGLAGSYVTYLASHMAFLETHLLPGSLILARTASLTATIIIFAFRIFYADSFLGVRDYFPVFSKVLRAAAWALVGVAVYIGFDITLNGQTSLRVHTASFGVISFVLAQAAALAVLMKRPQRVAIFYLCWAPISYFSLVRLLHDAVPSIGLHPVTLTQTHFWMCFGFLLAGIVAGIEIYLKERSRRRSEELRRRRMHDIALSASNSFWETGQDGLVGYLTGSDAGALGLVAGKPMDLGTETANGALATALAAREPFVFRFRAPGGERTFEMRGRPYSASDGKFEGFRGIISDVSIELARVEREAHQQHLAAVGQLAGVVAHEINNLLHPIISLTRRAASTLPGHEQSRRWLDTVTDAGQRAAEIVASLLRSVRPANQQQDMASLVEGVGRAFEALKPVMPEGVDLKLEISITKPAIIASKDAFQVLANLVSNSIYAISGSGEVHVSLTDGRMTDGRSCNRLQVADNGIGMDAATKARIFEPFFSSNSSEHRTGLGLSIVAAIVREHQGEISIESEPGQGTTIDIRFPVIENAEK